jgi:hypothetical protein
MKDLDNRIREINITHLVDSPQYPYDNYIVHIQKKI